MTIYNFTDEVNKRKNPSKPPDTPTKINNNQDYLLKELDKQDEKESKITAYQGEFRHQEDQAIITVEPDIDKITIDFVDLNTDERYCQFIFDSRSLYLIMETSRRMFKELDGVIDYEGY